MKTTNEFKAGNAIKSTHFEGVVTKSTKWKVFIKITGGNYGWKDLVGDTIVTTLRSHGGYCVEGSKGKCGLIKLVDPPTEPVTVIEAEAPAGKRIPSPKLEYIEILRSDSNLLQDGRKYETIRAFQADLDHARTDAPRGGAYDKTTFRIVFSGISEFIHTGRIDLHHISEDPAEPQRIVEHIRGFANYVRRSERSDDDRVSNATLIELLVNWQESTEESDRIRHLLGAQCGRN